MLTSSWLRRSLRGFNAFKNDSDFKEKVADIFYDLADQFSAKYESMGDSFLVDAQDESLALTAKQKQILLSRQTPSHQIWVATPLSGSLPFQLTVTEPTFCVSLRVFTTIGELTVILARSACFG